MYNFRAASARLVISRAGATVASSMLGVLHQQRCGVHERPFLELPANLSKGESYEMARDALLQLNIMTRRGIQPDALTYTSLIVTMGRAGLEWQAYKLFSRMIEQGVRPLPETYVALRDATRLDRTRLRENIQTKIEEVMETFPEQLADEEVARQRDEDRLCIAKFEEYVRGELPPLAPPSAFPVGGNDHPDGPVEANRVSEGTPQQQASGGGQGSGSADPVATMRIRHPMDAWNTAQWAEEMHDTTHRTASGESATDLRTALDRLHPEELRIFLAAQRQLRHGDKEQLIQRVVENVSERAVRAMLGRRQHYFRSVEGILAADMRVAHMLGSSGDGTNSRSAARTPVPRERDRTLSAAEVESSAPEILHTPWGIIRKPLRRQAAPPAPRSLERLERVRLSEDELLLVRGKAERGELDELPESLLRRYAFQFSLRWRRAVPLSLLEAVQWHATTFFPPEVLERQQEEGARGMVPVSPAPTPALRMQREEEGMQRTLENYEAFRVISQRTNNLQVVDNKEINLYLKRIRREALQRDRKVESSQRRERNVLAAASLAASAKSFTPPPGESEGGTHVLGWSPESMAIEGDGVHAGAEAWENQDGDADAETPAGGNAPDTSSGVTGELPPWAVFGGEEEFNLSTGHFGSPEMGRYQELSDSKFRVLPSREAQAKWSVDRHLLPSSMQDVVLEAELEQRRRHDAIEKEYHNKLEYKRYRKWDTFLRNAQEKKQRKRVPSGDDDEEAPMQPLPPKRRLAQLLRQGKDRERVSDATREKFNKSL